MKQNAIDKKNKRNLKVFSLFFSFLIWIYVVSSAEIEADKKMSLNYILPQNYSIDNNVPNEVTINITGPRVLVRKYVESKKSIDLNIKAKFSKNQRLYSFSINRKAIKLPLGLEISDVSLKNILVRLARTTYKQVPIKLFFSNDLASSQKSFSIDPETVTISGTKSVLDSIKFIKTKPLDESVFKANKEIVAQLDFNLANASLEQSNAVVSYKASKGLSKFTFTKIPIIFQSTKIIESSSAQSVELTVGSRELNKSEISKELIKVFANTDGEKKVLKLVVDLPQDLELLELKPDTVTVQFGNE